MEYKLLESSSFKALGIENPTFNSADVSFFATSSFIYTLLFAAIVGAAFYEYILVGVYRMEASENGIRKSNETFKRTTLGLLGVFSLFLIIFTINKGLLTGDVGLGSLRRGLYQGVVLVFLLQQEWVLVVGVVLALVNQLKQPSQNYNLLEEFVATPHVQHFQGVTISSTCLLLIKLLGMIYNLKKW